MTRSKHPQKASNAEIKSSKKIKYKVEELKTFFENKNIRLMFEDKAKFGRIDKPKYCCCKKGKRPDIPCHHIRHYLLYLEQ